MEVLKGIQSCIPLLHKFPDLLHHLCGNKLLDQAYLDGWFYIIPLPATKEDTSNTEIHISKYNKFPILVEVKASSSKR